VQIIRTVIPLTLTLVLVAIGVLHLIWAFSPWPLGDKVTFTKRVVGNDSGEMPPAMLSALVGLAMMAGGVLTLMVNDSIPVIGPEWLRTVGIYGLAMTLLGRGLGGYFMNTGATVEFQRLNTVFYSPLCVVLGLLTGVVAMSASMR
jgi:hypothetical protein